MAIYGQVCLEDTMVSWSDSSIGVEMELSDLFVTVRDEPTGTECSCVLDGRSFMTAVGIGLSWDGDGTPEQYKEAEGVMAMICADGRDVLRFIP